MQHQQKLDELTLRMEQQTESAIEKASLNLQRLQTGLNAMNPKAVLKRGYSIIIDKETGKTVVSPDIPENSKLKGILAEGEIDLRVDI